MNMFYRLVTITGAHDQGGSFLIEPTIQLSDGIIPAGAMIPMAGDAVQLRLPSGETRTAEIESLGVRLPAVMEDGVLRTTEPPTPPYRLTLSLRRAAIDDLSVGTEVWVSS